MGGRCRLSRRQLLGKNTEDPRQHPREEREEREEAGSQLSPAEVEVRPRGCGAVVKPQASERAGSCRAGSAGGKRGRPWNQQGHLQQRTQHLARESGNDL